MGGAEADPADAWVVYKPTIQVWVELAASTEPAAPGDCLTYCGRLRADSLWYLMVLLPHGTCGPDAYALGAVCLCRLCMPCPQNVRVLASSGCKCLFAQCKPANFPQSFTSYGTSVTEHS